MIHYNITHSGTASGNYPPCLKDYIRRYIFPRPPKELSALASTHGGKFVMKFVYDIFLRHHE